MIGRLVQRIPVEARKPIAGGLVSGAILSGIIGLLAVMAFSEATEEECTGHLWAKKCVDVAVPTSERLTWLAIGIGLIVIAVVGGLLALSLTLTQSHLKKYQAILTGVEVMSIQKIADITHVRPSSVRSEIQLLIDSDEISDFYIDYGGDQIVSRKYIPKTSHKTVVKCSECGGNNEVIVGITRHCSFCGQALLLGKA